MSDPVSVTRAATATLTGVCVYGLLNGADYGVLFGAFAGLTFYIASSPGPGHLKQLADFPGSWVAGIMGCGLADSRLQQRTGYREHPPDAPGDVIVAAVAIRFLTSLSNGSIAQILIPVQRGRTGAQSATCNS